MLTRSLAIVIVAYLIGSIPFGFLLVRLTRGGDIRDHGSGGTGATNVSRRAGKLAGVVVLVLDALKGAAAVLLSQSLVAAIGKPHQDWLIAAASVAVILGHIFPIWLGFRGGKGVATGVGVFLVLSPLAVLTAGLVFIASVWATRFVSLGSILGAVSIPVFIWFANAFLNRSTPWQYFWAAVVCGLLIVFAHRANIDRLVKGTENKFK